MRFEKTSSSAARLRSLPNGPNRTVETVAAPRRLTRRELPIDTETLARYLIGKSLVREMPDGPLIGRIVETEAYVIGDASCHGFKGETPRNRTLFKERGHAYVYFIYGCWFALNVSGERAGIGSGVLVRAVEPLAGITAMEKRRPGAKFTDIARGPGRFATAFAIDRSLDGTDLCAPGPLWLGAALRPVSEVGVSVRIGISREINRPLRFYERGNRHVSGPKKLNL